MHACATQPTLSFSTRYIKLFLSRIFEQKLLVNSLFLSSNTNYVKVFMPLVMLVSVALLQKTSHPVCNLIFQIFLYEISKFSSSILQKAKWGMPFWNFATIHLPCYLWICPLWQTPFVVSILYSSELQGIEYFIIVPKACSCTTSTQKLSFWMTSCPSWIPLHTIATDYAVNWKGILTIAAFVLCHFPSNAWLESFRFWYFPLIQLRVDLLCDQLLFLLCL